MKLLFLMYVAFVIGYIALCVVWIFRVIKK